MSQFRYPAYPNQPFTGQPPSMWSPVNRASDTRYTSGTAPYYEQKIMAAHGRQLAGIGEVQDEEAQPGYALNELNLLAEQDDVQANGIFDPPGDPNVPNIYPDGGVLAARYNLPGYLARERMFAPSEVRDVTTGRPIIPVPNSPVAFDTNAQVAFIERNMYGQPRPVVEASTAHPTSFESTVNVRQNPIAIQGFGQDAPIDKQPPPTPSRMQSLLRSKSFWAVAALAATGVYLARRRS